MLLQKLFLWWRYLIYTWIQVYPHKHKDNLLLNLKHSKIFENDENKRPKSLICAHAIFLSLSLSLYLFIYLYISLLLALSFFMLKECSDLWTTISLFLLLALSFFMLKEFSDISTTMIVFISLPFYLLCHYVSYTYSVTLAYGRKKVLRHWFG